MQMRSVEACACDPSTSWFRITELEESGILGLVELQSKKETPTVVVTQQRPQQTVGDLPRTLHDNKSSSVIG